MMSTEKIRQSIVCRNRVAEILGKEAALFVPSGVMANQLAIKTQTQPGDEVIVESDSHIFNFETAGAAFLSNVQLCTVKGNRGILQAEQVAQSIRSPSLLQSEDLSGLS
jgi:threonine aldolase